MRLKNSTDIPDEVVREVIRFCRPSGIANFDVRLGVAGCGSTLKGRAHVGGSVYHDRDCQFVNLYLGEVAYPIGPRPPVRSNYLPRPYLANKVEALVYLMAHELRHLWQSKVRKGRRVWGARGVYSERDADAYAIRMLRAWRRRAA